LIGFLTSVQGARNGELRLKSFSLELEHLDGAEHWRLAHVSYEGSIVYMVSSETGTQYRIEDLSAPDRARVERDLIFNLCADAQGVCSEIHE
jgi:hypothetical protein